MPTVRGWTEAQIRDRERVFEALLAKATRRVTRAVVSNMHDVLTAALTLSEEPEPTPSVYQPQPGVIAAIWTAAVNDELMPYVLDAFRDAAYDAHGALEAAGVAAPKVTYDLAADYLAASANRLKGVGDLVWNSIRVELANGYAAGESTHQLAARVRNVVDVTTPRANTIARTEVVAAVNAASLLQLKLAGFTDTECEKRWLATEDERTRAAHYAADGQTVPLYQPFIVGGEGLQFPGDPTGRADNVINCRCTLEYEFPDDAETLTAAAPWKEAQHPRNPATGEFIDKGAIADWAEAFMTKYMASSGQKAPVQWHEVPPVVQQHIKGIAEKAAAAGWKGPKQLIKNLEEFGPLKILPSPAAPDLALPQVGDPGSHVFQYFKDLTPEKYKKLTWIEKDQLLKVAYNEKQLGQTYPFTKLQNLVAQLESGGPPKPSSDTGFYDEPTPIGVGKVSTAGQPIKINTKTVYNTKYADGAVVAVKITGGATHELSWNEKKQKFVHKIVYSDGATWEVSLGKGAAYQEFKNDVNWLTPGTGVTSKTTPPKLTLPNFITPTSMGPNEIADVHSAHWEFFVKSITSDQWKSLTLEQQIAVINKDASVAKLLYGMGNTGATSDIVYLVEHYGMADGLNPPATLKIPPSNVGVTSDIAEGIAQIEAMNGPEFAQFIEDNHDDLVVMWGDALPAEKQALWDKAADMQVNPESKGFKPGDMGYLKPYNDLIDIAQKASKPGAQKQKVAIYNADGVPTDLNTFNDEDLTNYYQDITQQDWDGYAPETKSYLHGVANAAESMNENDEPNAALLNLENNEGPGSAKSNFPFIDALGQPIDAMDHGEFTAWLDSVTPDLWNILTPEEQAHVTNVAQFHGHQELLDFVKAPVTDAPAQAEVKSAHQLLHEQAVAVVKPVHDIGVPSTTDGKFNSLTLAQADIMQKEMLFKSGKTWTVAQKQAVAEYTTSVGYQTANAVLRNDQTRMKMFSEAQLKKAVTRSKNLQDAMLPTTHGAVLYRGTGAQAFGFGDTNVGFADLKALEGKTVMDRGFVSTAVVPQSGVGWDYTKKPIRMIIRAPKGTPAVYVSTATPGYQSENEMILGAGTSFRLDEIRPATAAEKAQFGSGLKFVVEATVVPREAPAKPKKTPASAVKPSVVAEATPKLNAPGGGGAVAGQHYVGGTPLKFNTAVAYKNVYPHGATVAERSTSGGFNEKITWDAHKKNFVHWTHDPKKGNWVQVEAYGKSGAYQKFKDESGWSVPGTAQAAGSGDMAADVGLIVAPIAKITKFDAATIQAQHGDVTKILPADHVVLKNIFKNSTQMGKITIKTPAPTTFKALALTVANWNVEHPDNRVNALQVLKIVDQKLTPPSGVNEQLYEKKIITWLGTAAGKKNAPAFINWAEDFEKAAKKSPSGAAAPQTNAATVHPNFKLASELGTPSTAANQTFDVIQSAQATAMHNKAKKTHPWNAQQIAAIKSYTGSSYVSMNQILRAGGKQGAYGGTIMNDIAAMQSAMYPAPQSFMLHRGTESIGISGLTNLAEVQKLVGQTFEEKGFSSGSVGGQAAFGGKKFLLEIEVPQGTPGAYVRSVSSHKSENEYILAAGTKFKVISVKKDSQYSWAEKYVLRLRVVP